MKNIEIMSLKTSTINKLSSTIICRSITLQLEQKLYFVKQQITNLIILLVFNLTTYLEQLDIVDSI